MVALVQLPSDGLCSEALGAPSTDFGREGFSSLRLRGEELGEAVGIGRRLKGWDEEAISAAQDDVLRTTTAEAHYRRTDGKRFDERLAEGLIDARRQKRPRERIDTSELSVVSYAPQRYIGQGKLIEIALPTDRTYQHEGDPRG